MMTIGYNPFDEDFSFEDFHEYRATAISLREENLRLKKNLKEYRDKIEQGTLIELPCKVGDTVYQFDHGGEIYELFILSITIYRNKIYYETIGIDFDNTAIGQSLFLTREEAEKKLKELQR